MSEFTWGILHQFCNASLALLGEMEASLKMNPNTSVPLITAPRSLICELLGGYQEPLKLGLFCCTLEDKVDGAKKGK